MYRGWSVKSSELFLFTAFVCGVVSFNNNFSCPMMGSAVTRLFVSTIAISPDNEDLNMSSKILIDETSEVISIISPLVEQILQTSISYSPA
jgi:hypothetical protein